VAVCVLGVIVLATFARRGPISDEWLIVGVLTALTVAGELRPIRVPMGTVGMEITVSTTFGFAMTLQYGPLYGCGAMALAVLITDSVARKAPWKIAFNAAQYAVAMGAGGLVLELFPGWSRHLTEAEPIFSTGWEVIPFAVSGLAFFGSNVVLLGIALALVARQPVLKVLREDFAYQTVSTAALLALSPICVVVAQRSIALLPILLIPFGAAYMTALVSLQKEHQALHDALTGLPNRTMLHHRLREVTARKPDDVGVTAAVLLLDLDRFKEINDSLGHTTGDRVLRQLGPRLQEMVDPSATVARLGGDEFGVVLPSIAGAQDAHEVGRRLLEAIAEPVTLDHFDLELGGSIGIALFPIHGTDADTLIRHADIAMYAAKDNLGGVLEYHSGLDHTSPLQLQLVTELREAIGAGDGLVVHYQPKVDVRTGLAVGAEALVRWEHPHRGMVRPDEFIPVAERTGLIRPLTVFVLQQAVAQCARWRAAGHDLAVSVNISARTLLDLDLPNRIDALLTEHRLSPEHLILEITESTIMSDLGRTRDQLVQLTEQGARISLDDYGTGHSSLAQIKSLPIAELKIDKSFITAMTEHSDDAHIARSTIELGQRLGLEIVAEGVETAEVWALLAQMGCHQAQGYHFSRPLPADQFLPWLDQQRRPRTGVGPRPPVATARRASALR
jgi:diguanylate cyclase (GGDEF)-like protein